MKKAILFLTLCAALAHAQTTTVKKTAPKAPAKAPVAAKPAAPAAQPLVLPKEAVVQPDGTWKYTDKNGKRWVYANTFFGLSRMEDMSDPNASPAAAKQAPSFDKFTDDGEVIHFERNTPFGPLKWERKKAELTEEERQAIASFKPAEKQ